MKNNVTKIYFVVDSTVQPNLLLVFNFGVFVFLIYWLQHGGFPIYWLQYGGFLIYWLEYGGSRLELDMVGGKN